MADFHNLENILKMNFREMRAKACQEDSFSATDEAMSYFVDNLLSFFTQFHDNPPTKFELKKYVILMNQITKKINQCEYEYHLKKYLATEEPEIAKENALNTALKNFESIPARMQFWARSEGWGEPIRNASNHARVVKHMNNFATQSKGNASKLYFHKACEMKPSKIDFGSDEDFYQTPGPTNTN